MVSSGTQASYAAMPRSRAIELRSQRKLCRPTRSMRLSSGMTQQKENQQADHVHIHDHQPDLQHRIGQDADAEEFRTQLHGRGDQIFSPSAMGRNTRVVVGVVVEQENDRDHDGKLNSREFARRRIGAANSLIAPMIAPGLPQTAQYRHVASRRRRAGGAYMARFQRS